MLRTTMTTTTVSVFIVVTFGSLIMATASRLSRLSRKLNCLGAIEVILSVAQAQRGA